VDIATEPKSRFPTYALDRASQKHETFTLSKTYLYPYNYLHIKMNRSAGTHVDMAAEPKPGFQTCASSNTSPIYKFILRPKYTCAHVYFYI